MSKRLLIVDDDAHLLRALEMYFRAAGGYEVRTARHGGEALLRLVESSADLIISDVRMPGADGHALVRRLRESPNTKLIPIIFLTAKDTTADRVAGLRLGVDAYLTKPFETEELLAIVENVLSRVERTHTEVARLIGAPAAREDNGGGAAAAFRDDDLTETEARVALAVARGLTNKAIADEFGVSVRTVETHIRRMLSKKGFSNRVELALYITGQSNQNS